MVRHSKMTLATTATLVLTTGYAVAQHTDPGAAAASNSLTPLLIITVSVIVLTIAFMALAEVLSRKEPAAKPSVQPDAEGATKDGDPAQAAAAFAAFEKAKLVGKKAQDAAANKDVKAGEPLSDEQPS